MTKPEAAIRRYWAEQRARGRKWQEFIAGLMADFEITDRDELIETIGIAEMIYEHEMLTGHGGEWSVRDADMLDDLIPAVWKTIELIRWLELPLARALAGVRNGEEEVERYAEVCSKEDELRELRNLLADVGRAAAEVPRKRRGRGKRKVHFLHNSEETVAEYGPLRAAMDVLAGYWKVTLGRRFKQDQTAWAPDGSPTRKAHDAVRFAYAIIEHIAPGRGQGLKTIAREYTSTYSK